MLLRVIAKYLSKYNPKDWWTAFVVTIGLLGAFFGIYSWYENHTKAPYVTFTVNSTSSVFNIQRPLPNLEVLFNGEDIRSSNMELELITITMMNEGTDEVLQSGYDLVLPLGFKVKNVRTIGQPRIANSSSDYISDQIKPKSNNKDTIELNKIILEPGSYVTLEIAALKDTGKALDFEAFGKIAGQAKIPILESTKSSSKSLLISLFSGNFIVQILRIISYGLLFLAIAIILLASFLSVKEILSKKRADQARLYIRSHIEPLVEDAEEMIMKGAFKVLSDSGGKLKVISQFVDTIRNAKKFNEYCCFLENIEGEIAAAKSRINLDDDDAFKKTNKAMVLLREEVSKRFNIVLPLYLVAAIQENSYLRNDLIALLDKLINALYTTPPHIVFINSDFDYILVNSCVKKLQR